ncbi:glycosyltransferase [Chryseobacterium sp. Leaf394]|uniref:glycosyltransferase n=1 Tax=Chryseobacterium sp. Leaf394 TaxID=1736361 RepID=UPI0006FD2B15|nr:glycosyltransferase [Chryseobacterium sp. Leaf394]KQS93200.1 hypothetical protein ASG21_12475 [Chryseobacterium sp. Leaf394]
MAILEEKLSFGMVLYKEELQDTVTYKTLLNSISSSLHSLQNKVLILVYDNTPHNSDYKKLENFTNGFVEVCIFSENANNGLPFAYNRLVEEARDRNKDWFVFLDQDTELPNDFYDSYLKADPRFKIQCPLVFSGGRLMSPSYYRNYRSSQMPIPEENQILLKDVSCINSGLMVNTNLFQAIGGYNKDLFLDFCDHDFVEKTKKYKIEYLGILNTKLHQDFSANTHSKTQALQRYILFLKDLKIYGKKRDSIKLFLYVDFPHLLKLTVKYKSLKFFKLRFL